MLHTVEFESEICHGMIKVPEEYHALETKHIKVIATIADENVQPTTRDNLNALRRIQIMAVNHPLAMPDDINIVSLPEEAADDIF